MILNKNHLVYFRLQPKASLFPSFSCTSSCYLKRHFRRYSLLLTVTKALICASSSSNIVKCIGHLFVPICSEQHHLISVMHCLVRYRLPVLSTSGEKIRSQAAWDRFYWVLEFRNPEREHNQCVASTQQILLHFESSHGPPSATNSM